MIAHSIKNVRLYYARWEDLPRDVKATFAGLMGADNEHGRAFYQLYFYWYNIAHEVSHALRTMYGKGSGKVWEEENAVNQLAVSYWRTKGYLGRLLELETDIRTALSNLNDPVPADQDRAAYLNLHYQEIGNNPAAYAHYQFNMVQAALQRSVDFPQALRRLVTTDASDGATIPLSPDLPLDEELPSHLVGDMRKTLVAYGIQLPEIEVICQYAPAIQFIQWDA